MNAGASDVVANEVAQSLALEVHEGMSSKSLYKRAFKMLKKRHRPSASRYKLKQAMLEFGNSGFPFEDFVAEILRSQGFEAKTRQLLQGVCVQHEVDVVAENDQQIIWVECKYHPMPESVSNIKIPLYIHSRFRDLAQNASKRSDHADKTVSNGWIVTNTRFSDDALQYGRCAGLHLVSWSYPSGGSLREMIDRAHLYPITCLTTLNRHEKDLLLNNGVVLCQALTDSGRWQDLLSLSPQRRQLIVKEARALCAGGVSVK